MNNIRRIEKLAADLDEYIRERINEHGETYEQAKAFAQERCVAGAAVWDLLDEKYTT